MTRQPRGQGPAKSARTECPQDQPAHDTALPAAQSWVLTSAATVLGYAKTWASVATRGCCRHLLADRPRPATQATLLLPATTRRSQAAPGSVPAGPASPPLCPPTTPHAALMLRLLLALATQMRT